MSDTVTHQMMMLRPMQAGLSGYARLQGEPSRHLVQINLRGLSGGEMRVFWYAGEGLVREVGRCGANQRGEAALSAEVPINAAAPRRLMALLITDGGDRPKPLAIGLCTAQSAGSLMDAKNALLALCDKLGRASVEASASNPSSKDKTRPKVPAASKDPPTQTKPNEAAISATIGKASQPIKPRSQWYAADGDLPREVFLPAIEARRRPDRRRYRRDGTAEGAQAVGAAETLQDDYKQTVSPKHLAASEAPQGTDVAVSPAPSNSEQSTHSITGLPADRLPALQWPSPFQSLAAHFQHNLPQRLMNWPGWRFVHVKESRLWIGYKQQDGSIRQVAYALPADVQPPAGQSFRLMQTATGERV